MSTYQIPPQDSHSISLEEAIAMTTLYRENRQAILKEEYQYSDILALNETFSKDAIINMLAATECVGLRIYYGMSEDLNVHAILVGVNDKGEDILPTQQSEKSMELGGGAGDILEDAIRCPIECPPLSPLNSITP